MLGELRTASVGAALPTIYLSDEESGVKSGAFNYRTPVGVGADSQDMLTAVVHSFTDEEQNVKVKVKGCGELEFFFFFSATFSDGIKRVATMKNCRS